MSNDFIKALRELDELDKKSDLLVEEVENKIMKVVNFDFKDILILRSFNSKQTKNKGSLINKFGRNTFSNENIKSVSYIEKCFYYAKVGSETDSCEEIKGIYKKSMPKIFDSNHRVVFENGKYSGDKINSLQRSFTFMKEKYFEIDIERDKFGNKYSSAFEIIDSHLRKNIFADISIPKNDNYEECAKLLEAINAMERFAMVSDTIGNQMVLPLIGGHKSLNVNKNNSLSDYMDLVLECVYHYYHHNKVIKKVDYSSTLKDNEEWLKIFGEHEEGWINFCENYMFEDYLDEYNKPIRFWDNHDFCNRRLKSLDDLISYSDNVCRRIERRGIRIIARIYCNNKIISDCCKNLLSRN